VPLPREFFARPGVEVAPDLLGCVLAHQTADGLVAVELTEVEAYAGLSDPASHAYRGQTRRNAVMFGPPGHAYVYFTYGMHFCVNLVCLLIDGSASAVLLRAGAIIAGEDLARTRRARRRRDPQEPQNQKPRNADGPPIAARDLARGPARLCQALDIDRSLDGVDVCTTSAALQVHAPGEGPGAVTTVRSAVLARGCDPPGTPRKIASGPRVGVSMATERPWRFWLADEPTVSVYRAHVPRQRKLVTP
jgi:DNA-3-methyladenine glycosylase